MDWNVVVLEISSDEEVGLDDYEGRGIADLSDDHDLDHESAELLYRVYRDDFDHDDGGDDSDEVVVVSEVSPWKKPRKNSILKSPPLVEVDDDCVILDHDPCKPVEARNDNPIDRDEDDDSDDLLIVSEKGQVACRDYPHSRHLCIKFPFSSTPNPSHCDQCYCYVCDSLAPCVYWGDGNGALDHCQATEKDEFWKLERGNSKTGNKGVAIPPVFKIPAPVLIQIPPIHTCPVSSGFQIPNIINQNRNTFSLPRNKYNPHFVPVIQTSSCTNSTYRRQRDYNLGTRYQKPVFKQTVSTGVSPRANYSVNESSSLPPHVVKTSSSFPPPNQEPDASFDFLPNYQLQLHLDQSVENPVRFQPHSVTEQSSVDPETFLDIGWPQSHTPHETATQTSQFEGMAPENDSSLAVVSRGSVDDPYEDWIYDDLASVDLPGSFGMNQFSSESSYVNAGTIFDL